MPKMGKKTAPLVSAHWRLRKLILKDKILKLEHVTEVMNTLTSPHQRTTFSKLYGPICKSERVAVEKVGRNNVGIVAKKKIKPGIRLQELPGKVSIRIPLKDEEKLKQCKKFPTYTSVVKREQNSIEVYRYLIGPLAFANAACTEHANVGTTTYSCLTTILNPESEVIIEKQLFYYYGDEYPINEWCTICKKEKKIKNKLTK
jgi:hypothetical protein